ncbi:electron carrier [Gracilaria domingensis]|nr:electron carrier [Gracilaria domingensis]
MAFVTSVPLLRVQRRALATARRCATPVATATKPEPPKDFSPPKPRRFYIRPDKAVDIAQGSFGQLLRAYAGVFVEGYRLKTEDGKLVEYSATLPKSKPTIPLRLFEFEACPFCRKVREAVTMLDLDVLVFPCPKDGVLYRQFVTEKGGKAQFPYLIDPNTDFSGYESDDIIKYLYNTYGPSGGRVPLVLSNAATFSAGLAASFRRGRGRARMSKTVPAAKPLELWGYEASPFVRIARETLSELELPYYLHTTARGSVKRAQLKELVGRFQVPYLVDPNTDIAMFESAEICEYLRATYGPDAAGAVAVPDAATAFMPGDAWELEPEVEKSLDPQMETDEVLEQYCEENPESDECRVYED